MDKMERMTRAAKKGGAMDNPFFERLRNEVSQNDAVLYMHGTAAFPQCSDSSLAAQILTMCQVEFLAVDVLGDDGLQYAVKAFGKAQHIPQLYIKGQLVGGCENIAQMYRSGALQQMLQDLGIAAKAA